MLKLLSKSKAPLCLLMNAKDVVIETDLKTGVRSLSFSYPITDMFADLIQSETYIQTEDYEFIVKEVNKESNDWFSVYAKPNIEVLTGKPWLNFASLESTIQNTIQLAIAGTGWTVSMEQSVTKKRTIRKETGSAYDIIQDCQKVFMVDIFLNTLTKEVMIWNQKGDDKGVYFTNQLNLKKLSQQASSYDFITRLIPIGKDDLRIDTGYVDNFQYSNKVIAQYWIDKRYTDAASLKEDAIAKLNDLSKPTVSYSCEVASFGGKTIHIGDTITIIDNIKGIKEKQRVVKMKQHPLQPEKDTLEIANRTLSFAELQAQLEAAASTVADITTDSGAIDGSKIEGLVVDTPDFEIADGSITTNKIAANAITTDKLAANSVTANKIQAGSIDASHIKAGTIVANSAIIDDAAITSAKIADAAIGTAQIQDAAINSAKIDVAQINSGHIQDAAIGTAQIADAAITVAKIQDAFVENLVATQGKFESADIGELTSDNIKAGAITTDKLAAGAVTAGTIAAGAITTGKLAANSITSEKIAAGTIVAGDIAANAITTEKINAGAVTAGKVAADAITAGNIQAGAITAGKLAANSVEAGNIKAGAITADKIGANAVTTDKLNANSVTAAKIAAGTITADKINASTISSIEVNASTITANKIASGEIKVGNANIVDGTISGAKISSATITEAQIAKATITDASIKSLNASKITAGTLDASKINVTNLKADSITTGSITVQGANLSPNSMWLDGDKVWSCANWPIDTTKTLDGANSRKIVKTGLSADTNHYLISNNNQYGTNTGFKCSPGEAFVASCKFWVPATAVPDGAKPYLGIWFYSQATPGGALTTAKSSWKEIDLTTKDSWQTITHSDVAPSNAVYVKLVVNMRRNGTLWVAQPMLSRGTIASIYQPHVDEQISDGAIDNDKLGPEAVTSDKLMVEELFVGENAFINNLKAVDIDAAQITTGKINSERLDITGLVSFEAFDDSLQPIFDVQGNKTYINGGTIATNTIKADKIDLLSGITVKGPDGTNTFAIANDGNVEVNGLLRSGNYMPDSSGYQISPNGIAELNQAIIRGSVDLPNAGITNYGATIGNENLLKGTAYDIISDAELNELWYHNYTSAHTFKTGTYGDWGTNQEYDAHIKGQRIVTSRADIAAAVAGNYTQVVINPYGEDKKQYLELKKETTYTMSGWAYRSGNCKSYNFAVWHYDDAGQNRVVLKSFPKANTSYTGAFEYFEYTFTTTTRKFNEVRFYHDIDTAKTGNSDLHFYNIKLEEGEKATPWCPSKDEQFNFTRIWAGKDYKNRDSAPFRVHQDGSLFATDGTFEGKLYGDYNNGYIHIHKDKIEINDAIVPVGEDMLAMPLTTGSEYVSIGTGASVFNTNVSMGNNSIEFNNADKTLTLNKTKLITTGARLNLEVETENNWYRGLLLSSPENTNSGAFSWGFRGSDTTDSVNRNTFYGIARGGKGARFGDMYLRRLDWDEDFDLMVRGNVHVKTAIKPSDTKNNIEMRNNDDGWGFYAT